MTSTTAALLAVMDEIRGPMTREDVAKWQPPTVIVDEPLQCSQGGVPYNKVHLDARDDEIRRLRKLLIEVRREAIEECAKAATFELANECESLGVMDPETGQSECSLEVRGDSCLCAERYEEQARIVKRIRALAQQPAKEPR